MACDLHPEDCLSDHYLPPLTGVRHAKSGFRAKCPSCGRDALSIAPGKSARVVWTCHAGCGWLDVRAALADNGIPDACLPRARARRKTGGAWTDAELLRRLRQLLDGDLNPGVFRLQVAMLLWETDPKTAAERLGMSRSAYYRNVTGSPDSGTEPQVAVSPETGTDGSSALAPVIPISGRRRRLARVQIADSRCLV